MEITFQKDGFIGIFDNVFEKEYLLTQSYLNKQN